MVKAGDAGEEQGAAGDRLQAGAQIINVKPAEIRSFLHNQLPPGRTQELKEELLLAGVPL